MSTINKPNFVYPLALSQNERDVLGYTATVTNNRDQIKKNFIYEGAKNPLTNKGTLTLSKRPGVTVNASSFCTGSSLSSYLIIDNPLSHISSTAVPWVFSTKSTAGTPQQILVGNGSSEFTVVSTSAANYMVPVFVDATNVNGSETIVLQAFTPTNPYTSQRVFHTTSLTGWTEITDSDFTGLNHRGKMEHLDGYGLIMDDRNRIYNTDLNSLTSVGASSYITKAASMDQANGLAKHRSQIIAFGNDTAEVYWNGDPTSTGSPLARISHLNARIGLCEFILDGVREVKSAHYYCVVGNHMYFVGRRAGGVNSVDLFSYDGSRFEEVHSGPYIEKILSERATSITGVYAVGFHGQAGVAIELDYGSDPINGNSGTMQALLFFPDWKEWFWWTSTIFRPINNGTFFLSSGLTTQDQIYSFTSANNYQDDGTSYSAEATFKIPTTDYSFKRMPMFGVEADTDTATNSLTFQYSDDDSSLYATFATIDLSQQKKVAFRGGAFRERHIRLVSANAQPVRLHNFIATIK